jgi:uncharacterized protein YbaP (TraB family)
MQGMTGLYRHGRIAALLLALLGGIGAAHADTPLHALWELHGRHNTVYLLGSVHILRPTDYPLPAVIQDAYRAAQTVTLEINLADAGSEVQSEMLASAMLPEGRTLASVLGAERYSRAQSLAGSIGLDLAPFEAFAPWFAAEAIAQLQLAQLGFEPQSGIDLYFLGRARGDGKRIDGLETAHDQIAAFQSLPLEAQSNYLLTSLEEAHELPREVDQMVHAWQRGDTAWFEHEMTSELGKDPILYQSLLVARNRKWIARIESLLEDGENHLIIVGTAHLVGKDSVLALLKKDGFSAVQR